MSNLGIFSSILKGKANDIYLYNGNKVIGSAVRLDRTGWIVVDQISLSDFVSSYAWTLGLTLLVSLIIWLTLILDLRKQLQRYVITPLEQLASKNKCINNWRF